MTRLDALAGVGRLADLGHRDRERPLAALLVGRGTSPDTSPLVSAKPSSTTAPSIETVTVSPGREAGAVHAHGLAGLGVDRAVAGAERVERGGLRGLRSQQGRGGDAEDRAEKAHQGPGTPHEMERIG